MLLPRRWRVGLKVVLKMEDWIWGLLDDELECMGWDWVGG